MRFQFHFIFGAALWLGIHAGMGATKVEMWTSSFVAPSITNVPPDLTNAVAIAAGSGHTLALTTEGRVVGWGNNTYGQINVPSGLSNVVAISASHSQSLALTISGTIVTWGIPACETNSPLHGLTNVVSFAGGTYGGFALLEDANYVTWICSFDNPYSPTGTFAITNSFWPAGPSNVVTADYSEGGTVTLDESGTARSRFHAVGLEHQITNLVSVSIGYVHALGLTADGRVLSWGRESTSNAPPNLTNAVAAAAGFVTSLVLLNDGKLIRWFPQDLLPVPETLYEGTNVLAIAAGKSFQIALLDLDGPHPTGALLPGPRVVTNGISIHFPTERGRIYLLEHKSTLADTWSFQKLVAGNGALREVMVPASSQGFFRTRRVR